jgi:proteasome lid subunit RPN8/RPN11
VLLLSPAHLRTIVDAAERAYPVECCGLLVGQTRVNGDLEVTEVAPSRNLMADKRGDRFEVDPALRLALQQRLRGGAGRVLGLYHSHPDLGAQPSETDLEMAWEPQLVWLITSVIDGQAVHTTAHVLEPDGTQFREIGLRTTDWRPYPRRDPVVGTGRED